MKLIESFSLADILFSFILITLLLFPIFRLDSLDTFSFSNNLDTLRGVRHAENLMEMVRSRGPVKTLFPSEFSPLDLPNSKNSMNFIQSYFEYKVSIRPSDLDKKNLVQVGVTIRWGGVFKNYYSLFSVMEKPTTVSTLLQESQK